MSTNELQIKAREIKELKRMKEELEAEITALEDVIKAHMGDTEEIIAGEYKIRWSFVSSSRFDGTALKAANPEMYKNFLKCTQTRRFTVA